MSVNGRYKVTVLGGESAEMVIRADKISVLPDGFLYIEGDRQRRKFSPDLWRNITITNDGGTDVTGASRP